MVIHITTYDFENDPFFDELFDTIENLSTEDLRKEIGLIEKMKHVSTIRLLNIVSGTFSISKLQYLELLENELKERAVITRW